MIRKARGIFAGLGLAAAMAAPASATSWGGNGGSYCGGDVFSTCFSVDLSWTVSGAGPTTFTTLLVVLKLRNDDTFNSGLKWFGVGLDQLPADIVSDFTSGPAGYQDPPPQDISNPGGPFTPGVAEAANPGGSDPGTSFRTWNFTFTGDARTIAQWDLLMQKAGVGYHAGGTTCGSTKVEVHGSNTTTGLGPYVTNHGAASDCDDTVSPPTEITPEPLSITLMATGLVGLAGAGFIKRRRNQV
jgi:hypothetical protein